MVDLVVGPQTYHRLPKMMEALGRGEKALDTDFPEEDKFAHLPKDRRARRGPTAFLTVQEGCDKFCSFCVVPYTRGAEVSRPVERLMREARDLVERGVREITLLGQNVNAYHGQGEDGAEWGLARLIRAMAGIDGLERIRFTTSHPNDMDDDLIAAHGDCDKLMPYLHLPVQAGSDRILKAMNRKHTAESYVRLIERIRAARPDLALVRRFHRRLPRRDGGGFPGDARSGRRGRLHQRLFLQVFGPPRHPRRRTRAGRPCEANDRLQRLQALLTQQQRAAQDAMVGREVSVLFEKAGAHAGSDGGEIRIPPRRPRAGSGGPCGADRAVEIVESGPNSLSGLLR
jgi:tRNA-2-methylthio-N6-dimethylallyladenosine synthase